MIIKEKSEACQKKTALEAIQGSKKGHDLRIKRRTAKKKKGCSKRKTKSEEKAGMQQKKNKNEVITTGKAKTQSSEEREATLNIAAD